MAVKNVFRLSLLFFLASISGAYATGSDTGADNNFTLITPDKTINEAFQHAINRITSPGAGSLKEGFDRFSSWDAFAFLDAGQFEKTKTQLNYYGKKLAGNKKVSASGEASMFYVILAGRYFRSSSDTEFVRGNWTSILKALKTKFGRSKDKDNSGSLYFLSMKAAAETEAAYIAKSLKMKEEADLHTKTAQIIEAKISKKYWNESALYYSTDSSSGNSRLTAWPAFSVCLDVIKKERALAVADRLNHIDFSNGWGVRSLSSASAGYNQEHAFSGGVIPQFSAWSVIAGYIAGRDNQALAALKSNLCLLEKSGYDGKSIAGGEINKVIKEKLNYSALYSAIAPVTEGLLGIKPMNRTLKISPSFPMDWDSLIVNNIRADKAFIDFEMRHSADKTIYTFDVRSDKTIKIDLLAPIPRALNIDSVLINGRKQDFMVISNPQRGAIRISMLFMGKMKVEIYHCKGLSVLPQNNEISEGAPANCIAMLSDNVVNGEITVKFDGKPKSETLIKVYAPGQKLAEVKNAEVTENQKGIYTIKVEFDKTEQQKDKGTIKVKFK